MNDYEAYEEIFESADRLDEKGPLFLPQATEEPLISVDFDDPTIASLPRVLLMGPRRGGKTSIQVRNSKERIRCTSFAYSWEGSAIYLACDFCFVAHGLGF